MIMADQRTRDAVDWLRPFALLSSYLSHGLNVYVQQKKALNFREIERCDSWRGTVILIPNKKQTSQKEYAIIVKGDDYGKEI